MWNPLIRLDLFFIFRNTNFYLLLMVIRFTLNDGTGAINLFNEKQTNHLVGESHL